MKEELESPPECIFLDAFYHAGSDELAEVLGGLSPQIRTVLAIGHNPGWQCAVYEYSGQAEDFSTANAALLELEAEDWQNASQPRQQWRLVDVLRPKELADEL